MGGFVSGVAVVLVLSPLVHFVSYRLLMLLSILGMAFQFLLLRFSKVKWQVRCCGFVSPGFEKVAEVFQESLRTGQEKGASFAAYYKGELVVDLWGGYADHEALRLWKEDSTSLAYSTTKIVIAVCLAYLYDRGLLDYDSPIVKYWPAFGQNNKECITVKTLLCHRAGLLAIQDRFQLSLARDDPVELGRLLAKEKPFWKPGTAEGYQTLTFGLYADQLVRRIDPKKRSLAKFYKEEIAKPFGIDFVIGETKEQFHRGCRAVSTNFGWRHFFLIKVPIVVKFVLSMAYSIIRYRAFYHFLYMGNPTDWKPCRMNDPDFREIPSGASHGIGTARGLAKLLGILANGGKHNGHTLLMSDTVRMLCTPLSDEYDRLLLRQATYGPGTTLLKITYKGQKPHYIFGHGGAGGQMAFCDPEVSLGWSYLTNFCNILHTLEIDHRYVMLEKALYECVSER